MYEHSYITFATCAIRVLGIIFVVAIAAFALFLWLVHLGAFSVTSFLNHASA